MTPDVPTFLCMRPSALYDILNDSYDVTERKTGSLVCRLAMAISFSGWHVSLFPRILIRSSVAVTLCYACFCF